MTTAARSLGDMSDAAALVAFGCQPRLRPLALPAYKDLLTRFRLDGVFRDVVESVCAGLGLTVIEGHPREGLVLHPHGELFRYRLTDGQKLGVQDRLVLGMAHLSIAARAYPTPEDLEEDTVKRVGIEEVDDFARHLVARLAEAAHDGGLAPPHAELDRAWRAYAKLPPGRPTPKRQLSQSSTQRVIKEALDWLVHQGQAYHAHDLGAGQYRLAHRYRLQVREVASKEAFALLCDIRREQLAEEE